MPAETPSPLRRFSARLRRGLAWLLPALGLALMPKCPACLAGYIAVMSGASLSLPLAERLRESLVLICVAALVFLAWRHLMPAWRRRVANR